MACTLCADNFAGNGQQERLYLFSLALSVFSPTVDVSPRGARVLLNNLDKFVTRVLEAVLREPILFGADD